MIYNKFQDYLFNRLKDSYGEFYGSYDEFLNHIESGEVKISIPDVLKFVEKFENQKTLPSQFQYGDDVILNFFNSGTVNNCKIIKVSFNENQVFYDVEIKAKNGGGEDVTTRLHNIRSLYVLSANDMQSQTLIQE